jgi:hypothetical protein
MKNKLIFTILFLCAINFLKAQEDLAVTKNVLQDVQNFDSKWSFGLIVNGSVSFSKREFELNNFKDRDTNGGFGLGVFADYRINKNLVLRTETGVDANNNLRPYINFQAEYFIKSKWSLYAGAGMYYNPDTKSVFKRDSNEELGVNPVLLVGTRYKFNHKWATDLRYHHDLLPQAEGTGSIGDFSLGGNRTISLGINYKF